MNLIAFAVRGAIVLGLVVVALPFLARASAATRRLALVLGLISVVALPLATAALPPLHLASAPTEAPVDARALAAASAPDPVARAGAIAEAPAIAAAPAAPAATAVSPWTIAFALWALGAAAVLARLAIGLVRARRLARRADLVGVEHAGARRVELRASTAIESPAVIGLMKPVILLPRDVDTWSAERRRVVLLHELAHVARRDCLANAVAQVACALHWFNPLAWIAARRLRMEQELAADDLVLDAGARPSSYAQHLLELATIHTDMPTGALAMAERPQIAVRIRALLVADRSRSQLGRTPRRAVTALALALAAVVACATPDRAPPTASVSADASGHVQRREGAPLDAISPTDLTLDPALQAIAEDETDRMTAEWKPRAAVVIVLDPQTGNVLAMTSRSADAKTEVAAQRAYVPGSTMKSFLVAAALEEGAITPTQRFDVHAYGTLHDASPEAELDVTGILAMSSNIGAAKIFDALGGAKLGSWLQRFHFAEAAPLQLSSSAAGAMPSPATVGVAIGEGLTATPIQVAAAFSAIANGGVYHAPTLVHRVDSGERVMRDETAHTVMTMLEAVVTGDNGTGKAARVEGVRVAGKTGTAELEPHTQDGAYYSSFVGAAPLDHPRYVILVGVEAPQNHGTGGQVAAPVFGRIAKRALER